jgi:hypothetical protein
MRHYFFKCGKSSKRKVQKKFLGVESPDVTCFIPDNFAPDAPSKKAYDFDPYSYTWINRKTEKKSLESKNIWFLH